MKEEKKFQLQLKINLYRNINVSILKYSTKIKKYLFTTGSKTVAHHLNLIQRKSSLLNIFNLTVFKIKTNNQEIHNFQNFKNYNIWGKMCFF